MDPEDKRSRIVYDGPVPLWRQVAEDIAREIADGSRSPQSRLPTEFELAAMYGVGRTTIRRAMLDLSERGLVTVSQGKGTYVASRDVGD